MRKLALAIGCAALSAEAPPQAQIASFNQALARGQIADASAIIDNLIAQRTPTDGKPKPDPLLNALIGRLYLAANNFEPASVYLEAAVIGELPPPLRATTALAHGRALEATGRRTGALTAYREASAASVSDSERQQATLGISRSLLPVDPAAARTEIAGIARGPASPQRWEARAILAEADSLTGDASGAELAAHEAWSDASTAPVDALAPLHVAVLQAGLAAARHDENAERAMLTAAGGLAVTPNPGLSQQLPVCGAQGIRPDDYVIFGYVSGPFGNRQIVPISASRSEIVPVFQDALSLVVPVKGGGDAQAPFGTVFNVACRTVVNDSVLTKPLTSDPVFDWFISQGLYPASAMFYSDDRHVTVVANRIGALEAKFGKDSPLLMAPRWQLLLLLERRARAGQPIVLAQVTSVSSELAAGLRRSGAPEWMALAVANRARLLHAHLTGEQIDEAQAASLNPLRQMPPELARSILTQLTSNIGGHWQPAQAQFLVDVSGRITPALSGLERQSWLLAVANAERTLLRDSEAAATLASAQLPPDVCVRMDQPPKLLEQHFTYDDYPQELIQGDQVGAVLFDFDVSAAGAVGPHRIVYSLPAGLFDQVSEKGLATVRYGVPYKDGKPSACRGVYQPIVWRLDSTAKAGTPSQPPESGPNG